MNYDYRKRHVQRKIERHTESFFQVFSDREIKILLIWAVIGPFCALAYIIWKKYTNLRWLSIIFFFINIGWLVGQLGGWMYLLPKLI